MSPSRGIIRMLSGSLIHEAQMYIYLGTDTGMESSKSLSFPASKNKNSLSSCANLRVNNCSSSVRVTSFHIFPIFTRTSKRARRVGCVCSHSVSQEHLHSPTARPTLGFRGGELPILRFQTLLVWHLARLPSWLNRHFLAPTLVGLKQQQESVMLKSTEADDSSNLYLLAV